jgi:histidinol-phosphate phosphatase family protein
MRICLISGHASPLAAIGGVDTGGQNVYVAQVARHLAKLGHAVDVLTRRDDAALPDVVDAAPGMRVVHVDAGPPAFVPEEQLLRHMPQFEAGCASWMRGQPTYGVIHANFFMSGWVGLRLRRAFGVPLVTTFHALGLVRREHEKEADAFAPERIDIERELAAGSDRIIAECPQEQADLLRLYDADARRMTMVPCGFDEDEFRPCPRRHARRALGIPDREFMVLQLGRMVPRKGIETVVRAMALLPGWLRARLHVVGGDCDIPDERRTPEIGRLRAIARECRCDHQVVFEGCKRRDELHLWYAASDVFVTVPWYEAFGITPLEAMACARPVIGSAVGGVRYSVVHTETGLLVPPKDERALALALSALHDDRQLAEQMGEAGLARARRLFTWERVARALEEVYRGVAAPAPAPAPIMTADGAAAVADAGEYTGSVLCVSGMDVPPLPAERVGAGVPAIFIDKDGALLEDLPYNVDPARARFAPTAFQALRRWRDAGYALVVVSNQSGLARGLFERSDLSLLHRALAVRLAEEGIVLQGFYACPHAPGPMRWAPCGCRKPAPGLLTMAARAHGIDLDRSWMVGDVLDDVEAGHQAGCRSVLVDTGNETEWQLEPVRRPEARCRTLLEAAEAILGLARVVEREPAAPAPRNAEAVAGQPT